jgi:hypothetical protein
MVVGFTTTYAISAYHHWCCEFESRSGRGVQHYDDKVCQWLATGRWIQETRQRFNIGLHGKIRNTNEAYIVIGGSLMHLKSKTDFTKDDMRKSLFFNYSYQFAWWCMTSLSTIFQLYRYGQFLLVGETTDLSQVTDKLYRHNVVYLALVVSDKNIKGPLWPWSYGSWIYNYVCNQCLSPLMLWVRISIRARYTTLWR